MTDYINNLPLNSLVCNNCGKSYPSNTLCECGGSQQLLSNQLTQIKAVESQIESSPWECFLDHSYYDMYCVRPKHSRNFGAGFHLVNRDEAYGLCDLLNTLTKGQQHG